MKGPDRPPPRGWRRGTLSEADRELWRQVARDIRPLRPAPGPPAPSMVPPAPDEAVAPEPARRAAATVVHRPHVGRPPPLAIGTRGAGLDDRSWRVLGTGGRQRPERRLDLHGHTLDAAFLALRRFLHQASADRVRAVEIVTGHGRQTGGGAIRRELPLWLDRPELRVLIVAGRHPADGNQGAVRLQLRRRRG